MVDFEDLTQENGTGVELTGISTGFDAPNGQEEEIQIDLGALQAPNAYDRHEIDLMAVPMTRQDLEQKLKTLNDLEHRIIKVLLTASEALEALEAGKSAANDAATTKAKEAFATATRSYFHELEDVSVALRKEVAQLHEAAKDKVFPIALMVKAEGVGRRKEESIWKGIREKLRGEDDVQDVSMHDEDSGDVVDGAVKLES